MGEGRAKTSEEYNQMHVEAHDYFSTLGCVHNVKTVTNPPWVFCYVAVSDGSIYRHAFTDIGQAQPAAELLEEYAMKQYRHAWHDLPMYRTPGWDGNGLLPRNW